MEMFVCEKDDVLMCVLIVWFGLGFGVFVCLLCDVCVW